MGAGLLLGGLAASGPASAATSSCGSNQVCLYTGSNETGAKLVVTGDRATLGSFDLAVSSISNHTNKFLCGYPNQNFVPGRAPVDYMIMDGGFGLPFLDGYDNRLRSVELVSSSLDCGMSYDHPNWADVPQHRAATGSGTSFGDLNHDGYADLMVRDKAGGLWSLSGAPGGPARRIRGVLYATDSLGQLWLYLGNGNGTFQPRRLVGTGWKSLTAIVPVGDVTGDGTTDLTAFAGTAGDGTTGGLLRSLPGYTGGTFGASTGPASFGLRTTSVTF